MITLAAATLIGGLAAAAATSYAAYKSSKSSSQAISSSDYQFDKQTALQDQQFKDQMDFLDKQHSDQMDFANRQLTDNTRIADENLALQREAYEYQKQLNTTQMEREDTAIQRQIKDYAAAGLSPLAAIGGNGAGSASLSAGAAPQYDMSGINAAAGQYADFARQYAQLKIAASQDYMKSKSQLAQTHNASILGARLSLAQMKADYMYKGASMAQQTFNDAVNARNKDLNNKYLQEQLDYLKDKHDWENLHGYRDSSLAAAISNFATKLADKYNLGDKVEDKIDSVLDGIKSFANQAPEKIITTGKEIATQINNLNNVTENAKKSMILFLIDTMVDQIQRSRELNESQKKEYTNKAKKELKLGL